MPLFEVAILKKEKGDESLILSPVSILAKDANTAVICAILKKKSLVKFDPNKHEVLVRPF